MENIKAKLYKQLVSDVKNKYSGVVTNYGNDVILAPAEIPALTSDGAYDVNKKKVNICNEINLYTYWQGLGYANFKEAPKIKYLLVAQDWGNPFDLSMPEIENIIKINGDKEVNYLDGINIEKTTYKTDGNLQELFSTLKSGSGEPYNIINQRYAELFFTNFCLRYRKGKSSSGMTEKIMMEDAEYFKRLCAILEPENILCLGKLTYECVKNSFSNSKGEEILDFNEYIESEYVRTVEYINYDGKKNSCNVFALAHPGTMGTMNRNKTRDAMGKYITDSDIKSKKIGELDRQLEDWRKINRTYNN